MTQCGLDSSGSGEGPVTGPCKSGHETSSSVLRFPALTDRYY